MQALAKAPVNVVLIDKENHHLFQPLLYQVATSVLPTSNIAFPIRRIFRKQATPMCSTTRLCPLIARRAALRFPTNEARALIISFWPRARIQVILETIIGRHLRLE